MTWKTTGADPEALYNGTEFPSLDLKFADNKTLVDEVSGDNLITFTRSSIGTYVDANGVIQTASTDAPRFDHDPVTGESLGLLVEESRTNYFASSTPTSSSWAEYNGASITDNQATGPDGVTNSASLVTFPATGGAIPIIASSSAGVSGTVTVSAYVRAVTGTVSLQVGTNISYGTTQIVGTSWTRVQFTTSVLGSSAGLRSGDVNNVQNFYVWGAQIEVGSFPTSYIPTSGSTVTRAADVASITGSNFSSWYNQSAGTVFGSVTTVVPSNVTNGFLFQITDGTSGERIELGQVGSGDSYPRIQGLFRYLNTTTASFTNQETGWNSDGKTLDNIAFAWDNAGFTLQTKFDLTPATGTGSYPQNLTQMSIAHQGHISRLTYYPYRLSNTRLQTITT